MCCYLELEKAVPSVAGHVDQNVGALISKQPLRSKAREKKYGIHFRLRVKDYNLFSLGQYFNFYVLEMVKN